MLQRDVSRFVDDFLVCWIDGFLDDFFVLIFTSVSILFEINDIKTYYQIYFSIIYRKLTVNLYDISESKFLKSPQTTNGMMVRLMDDSVSRAITSTSLIMGSIICG